ncbi:50S ribosomal protein L18, partial [miscellaneous Crenarchaeota group-15 archaeon DG-45]
MARGPRYRVPFRRRREHKTDYKARRAMATSGIPRLVVRPSAGSITVQVVRSEIEGDRVVTQTASRELAERFGWLGGGKSTPAAYLLGLIAGRKALKEGVESAILDIGLGSPTRGSRLFAAAKGARDAGLRVPCDDDIAPDAGRIEGAAIAAYAGGLEEPKEYERRFSRYIRRGLRPEGLPDHFRAVKARIG